MDEPCINSLLNKLEKPELDLILSASQINVMTAKEIIFEPGHQIESIDFLETAVVGIFHPGERKTFLDVSTIGFEGYTGVGWALANLESAINQAVCLYEGTSWRIPVSKFKKFVAQNSKLHKILIDYELALFNNVVNVMACSYNHDAEKRCARWILVAIDRIPNNELFITQNDLANILGVSRTLINRAAIRFQQLGLIEYSRGRLRILDREGLKAIACSCYERLALTS